MIDGYVASAAAVLARLDKTPLIDFGMRLGEASGAALVIRMLRAAAECHAGMATFAEAAMAEKAGLA